MRVEDHPLQEIVPLRTALLDETQFDIQRLQLVIEPLREPFQSKLRHIVEGAGRHRRQYAHERAYVDEHATFIGAEVRQETSNDVDGAAYIERELPINRTFLCELQRSVEARAGIVDHYVDLPESSAGLLLRYLHFLQIRYI